MNRDSAHIFILSIPHLTSTFFISYNYIFATLIYYGNTADEWKKDGK
jgi:hypothetical protein